MEKDRPPGRPPGYKHSEETRQKMSAAHKGNRQSPSTCEKIRGSLRGQHKSEVHREKISYGRLDIDGRCVARLAELKANYPDQVEFFEDNEQALLLALRDIKSDKELDDIKRYIETEDIDKWAGSLSYQYSSFPSHEDVVIDLLDEYHKQIRELSTNS